MRLFANPPLPVGARVACRVPAEKSAKLAGLKLGDKVKIYCLDGQLCL